MTAAAAAAALLSYEGRRVVVTGAGSGIGAAAARMAGELGAEVHAVDLRPPDVPVAGFVEADLGDPRSVERAVDVLAGPVHALFNCAGVPQTRPGTEVVAVNFLGLRHLTELLLPAMPPGSAVASVASLGAVLWAGSLPLVKEALATSGFDEGCRWFEAHPELLAEEYGVSGAYSFSKMCVVVHAMVEGARLGPRGVRINTVSPAVTATPMLDEIRGGGGGEFLDLAPRPLGRDSTADEQAAVLVFLNSPAASYVSGVNVYVDGGFSGAVLTGTLDLSSISPG